MDGKRHYARKVEPLPEEAYEATKDVSVEQLRQLVRLLDQSDVSEIEVKRVREGMRLILRKAKAPAGIGHLEIAPGSSGDEGPSAETKKTIVSPLVGVFHAWAKPKGKALVAVGDQVKVGQLLGTIQSLNVLSDVESSCSGRISEILVQDGQPVEYGQPLMTIESVEEA